MSDRYTIKLDGGKYTVIKYDTGGMEFLRHGEAWPAADDLKHVGVVRAMHDRIEELEMAIGQVLDGSLDSVGRRRHDGMGVHVTDQTNQGGDASEEEVTAWYTRLNNALEQKE